MLETERFQTTHGWAVREKVDRMHRYHLDDDAELTSSLVLVDRIVPCEDVIKSSPLAGRRVSFDEIPSFYGRQVLPPYPRYIRENGAEDYDWGELDSSAGPR